MHCKRIWMGLLAMVWLILANVAWTQSTPVDQPSSTFNPRTKIWTLQTSAMQAVFSLTTSGVFKLQAFSTTDGRVQLYPVDGDHVTPVSLIVDGQVLDQNIRWTLVDTFQTDTTNNGIRRTIVLKNDKLSLQVGVNIEIHPNQPFFRYFLTVDNRASYSRTISGVNLMNWSFDANGNEMQAFAVHQYRGGSDFFLNPVQVALDQQPDDSLTLFTGAQADHMTYVALGFPSGNGLIAGWEFDGWAHVTAAQGNPGAPVTITGGPDNLRISLDSGGSATLPGAFIGLYRGDWDEAGFRTQRYVEAVLALPIPDSNFPYVMFDTWGYGVYINETTVHNMVDRAAAMGVEVFILDLGWTTAIGDDRYDPGKFRSGLRAISDYVHSKNMKLGLHWTPTEAEPKSQVMTDHPEWMANTTPQYFNAKPLCIGHAPAQAWARTQISDLVNLYGADWLTQDGEGLVKQCTDPTHTHGTSNGNWANSVDGIDSLVSWSDSQFPNLLWENNSDGGEMLTFQMVKNYVTAASCDACGESMRLQAVYGMSYVFPPRYIDRYVTGPPNSWTMRTSEFGGPLILMEQITQWSQQDMDTVAKEIAIYKQLRSLIRDGKVYHLGPYPSDTGYSAIESFNYTTESGVIYAYRVSGSQDSIVVTPRGLHSSHMYNIVLQDAGTSLQMSGADLMSIGITVPLKSDKSSEIVYINKAS